MRTRRSRKLFKLKLRPETVRGILSITLAIFSFLSLVALFFPSGAMLTRLNEMLWGQFSWSAFFFIFVLLQISALMSKIKIGIARPNAILGTIFMLLALLGISQAGAIGQQIFQALISIIPLSIGVFFVLLGVALFGLTIFLNLTLGEALETATDALKSVKEFFKTYLHWDQKSPVFLKDNLAAQKMEITGAKIDPKTPLGNANSSGTPNDVKTGNNQMAPTPPGFLGSQIIQNEAGEQVIWEYPPIDILGDTPQGKADRGDIKQSAAVIEKTLESFGLTARVAEINSGPAVTQYALEIAIGTKLSKITSLQNDLALALAAPGQIRIEAPIPGRSLVGIEIPNKTPEFVPLRKILEADKFQQAKSKLTVVLGLDVSALPQVVDISKMPHMLIAGSTGSGKSVCINAFLMSLLFRNSPNELKLILVDPKRVELSLYNGIPHLMTPVIVDLEKVLSALKWAISEMERRYKTFASVGVRNIDGYNELSGFQALPYIVIVIDEMADLMMFAPVEVEDAICRLAQMARATGIHLILATQRPSVDVLTGLIKANIPARIAFNVTSMIDSRVIIDSPGAEKLIGRGDMLFIPPDQSKPARIQGAFVSDKDVNKVVEFLKSKGAPVQYTEEVTNMPLGYKKGIGGLSNAQNGDPLLDEAIRIVCQNDRASASLLQRKLSIGYSRAARILDTLQEVGIVGPGEGSKPRDVLIRNADEYFAQRNQPANPSEATQ